ncbi:Leucine--tRNA ligase [compost metagenome]
MEIVVQVNGKIADRVKIAADLSQEAMQEAAFALPKVKELTDGKSVVKVVAVKGKLVNIVVK